MREEERINDDDDDDDVMIDDYTRGELKLVAGSPTPSFIQQSYDVIPRFQNLYFPKALFEFQNKE